MGWIQVKIILINVISSQGTALRYSFIKTSVIGRIKV